MFRLTQVSLFIMQQCIITIKFVFFHRGVCSLENLCTEGQSRLYLTPKRFYFKTDIMFFSSRATLKDVLTSKNMWCFVLNTHNETTINFLFTLECDNGNPQPLHMEVPHTPVPQNIIKIWLTLADIRITLISPLIILDTMKNIF